MSEPSFHVIQTYFWAAAHYQWSLRELINQRPRVSVTDYTNFERLVVVSAREDVRRALTALQTARRLVSPLIAGTPEPSAREGTK